MALYYRYQSIDPACDFWVQFHGDQTVMLPSDARDICGFCQKPWYSHTPAESNYLLLRGRGRAQSHECLGFHEDLVVRSGPWNPRTAMCVCGALWTAHDPLLPAGSSYVSTTQQTNTTSSSVTSAPQAPPPAPMTVLRQVVTPLTLPQAPPIMPRTEIPSSNSSASAVAITNREASRQRNLPQNNPLISQREPTRLRVQAGPPRAFPSTRNVFVQNQSSPSAGTSTESSSLTFSVLIWPWPISNNFPPLKYTREQLQDLLLSAEPAFLTFDILLESPTGRSCFHQFLPRLQSHLDNHHLTIPPNSSNTNNVNESNSLAAQPWDVVKSSRKHGVFTGHMETLVASSFTVQKLKKTWANVLENEYLLVIAPKYDRLRGPVGLPGSSELHPCYGQRKLANHFRTVRENTPSQSRRIIPAATCIPQQCPTPSLRRLRLSTDPGFSGLTCRLSVGKPAGFGNFRYPDLWIQILADTGLNF
ncbi:hypothetical protein K435DRAFT_849653 [Dendrothele bispora CBS 962.96]|uniref:Uncharacterized protein n=1 Tax=Dendrothele bispora (strain CBS 962.96) TaxID=1314807 RepID=A0A4S8MTB3_DENBC|nr:hypothetical protein K435DRAFT_849653 [Dendrothele bispora CBS 962.96]